MASVHDPGTAHSGQRCASRGGIALRLAYDGTGFSGAARQLGQLRADGQPVRTVQGALEDVLARVYRAPVQTRLASRTDAGVHARDQIACFDAPREIPTEGLLQVLNRQLPRDLAVHAAHEVPVGYDARHDNGGKRYVYRLHTGRVRDPFADRTAWRQDVVLNVDAMASAALAFGGTHDFAAFRAADCQANSTVRTVHEVVVRAQPPFARLTSDASDEASLGAADEAAHAAERRDRQRLEIVVDGSAFLKNMVRIMVGTLYEVGRGAWPPARVLEVLQAGDRRAAGRTAPPEGLTLAQVRWSPP